MTIRPEIFSALRTTDAGIETAQTRIATGKRINSAIDDAIGFNRITHTQASISATSVKLNTLEFGLERLNARDQVLGSMQETVMRFQELATMASTGINQLRDIEPEMRALKDALFSLANTQDAAGRMFAGSSNAQPFVLDPVTGAVTYAGAPTANVIDVDGVRINGSVVGTPLLSVFGALENVLASTAAGTAPSPALVTAVQNAVETLVGMRTAAGAQAAGANNIKSALTARSDREQEEVSRLQSADLTVETIRLTEGQRAYEAILRMTGMELNRRRLMDFL
jgi:flagellin-like hook-associated protein FlgL